MKLKSDVHPHDLDAEQYVLGSLMIDKDALHLAASILGETQTVFFKASHQLIYAAALRLSKDGDPIDLYTLTDSMKRAGDLVKVGGVRALYDIQEAVPTSANVEYYAKVVHEMSVRRQLISGCVSTLERAQDVSLELEDTIHQGQRAFFDLYRSKSDSWCDTEQLLAQGMNRIEGFLKGSYESVGIPTGLPDLDQIIYGLCRGDLVIAAARPSMGKSSFAHNLALNVAMLNAEDEEPKSVAFFSTEMFSDRIAVRMLSTVSGVSMSRIRNGMTTAEESKALVDAAAQMESAQIHVNSSPGLTLMDIRSESRRLKIRSPNLSLIVVDYLQQLDAGGKQHNTRDQELSEYSRALKDMAHELNVCVLALSQLNRSVESRVDKRPRLSDLRESGAIEQDADIVLFLYREDYYEEDSDKTGEMDVIVRKHREGPLGTATIGFDKETLRFSQLEFIGFE